MASATRRNEGISDRGSSPLFTTSPSPTPMARRQGRTSPPASRCVLLRASSPTGARCSGASDQAWERPCSHRSTRSLSFPSEGERRKPPPPVRFHFLHELAGIRFDELNGKSEHVRSNSRSRDLALLSIVLARTRSTNLDAGRTARSASKPPKEPAQGCQAWHAFRQGDHCDWR